MQLTFQSMPYRSPDVAAVSAELDALVQAFARASDGEGAVGVLRRWDLWRRTYDTMRSYARIRFSQDTRDEGRRAEKVRFDKLEPVVEGHETTLLRQVLGSPHRSAIEDAFGPQALALWELRVTTFDARIAGLVREESALRNDFDALRAQIRFEHGGRTHTLATIRGEMGHPERDVRRAAAAAEARAMGASQEALDGIYDDLVKRRHAMARALGLESFTALGYARMRRTDYGPEQVASFREQVLETVLPAAERVIERRRRALGVEALAWHDETVPDPSGVPRPRGDRAWVLERTHELFGALGEDFARFFQVMDRRALLDLEPREGKVSGGYCDILADFGVPFIFANFNGTEDDVRVLLHECGHAFQVYRSLDGRLLDHVFPTFEACEIHSFGMEYLCHPEMERYFGEDADRYRRAHLEKVLLFIPYGAAIDEFQHRVYAEPEASPDRRAEMWRQLEARYLPWRRYEGCPYYSGGRFWQRQLHVYKMPFYYIDYCLAKACALQLWARAREDRAGALAVYRALCEAGGAAPFSQLVASAGLASPFEAGTLESVVNHIEDALR